MIILTTVQLRKMSGLLRQSVILPFSKEGDTIRQKWRNNWYTR